MIQPTVKSPVSVQVLGALSSRAVFLLRKVDGNMVRNTRQIITINYVNTACECIVFLGKEYIFMHDLAPCHNSNSTRNILQGKNIPVLEWPGNSPNMSPTENAWNFKKKEIDHQMPLKKADMWQQIST